MCDQTSMEGIAPCASTASRNDCRVSAEFQSTARPTWYRLSAMRKLVSELRLQQCKVFNHWSWCCAWQDAPPTSAAGAVCNTGAMIPSVGAVRKNEKFIRSRKRSWRWCKPCLRSAFSNSLRNRLPMFPCRTPKIVEVEVLHIVSLVRSFSVQPFDCLLVARVAIVVNKTDHRAQL